MINEDFENLNWIYSELLASRELLRRLGLSIDDAQKIVYEKLCEKAQIQLQEEFQERANFLMMNGMSPEQAFEHLKQDEFTVQSFQSRMSQVFSNRGMVDSALQDCLGQRPMQ